MIKLKTFLIISVAVLFALTASSSFAVPRNTINKLECAAGEVPKGDGGVGTWVCASDDALAPQTCPEGEVMVGIDVNRQIVCSSDGGGGGGGGGGTLTLQNDSFVAGGPFTTIPGAFSADDEYAATLGPVPGTGQLTKVRVVFGGTGPEPFPSVNVRVKVYQESGNAVPGTVLYDDISDVFTIIPSNDALNEFDLSAANVIVNGGSTIRVSIRFVDTPATTIGPARDADGFASPGRNWVFTEGAWVSSESLGLTSDWILRAVILPEGN